MSGSTIGSVVGAGIGFLIGGPAGARIGWMAGGLIGGVVAPEKIHGPKLTDARAQTAQDGVPRTYGYGTFPCTGNLIWVDPTIKEVKKKERGKGGPEQITYTYTRSYAIAVCRGPIEGYLIVKRNGKIVYDARTDAELTALGFTSEQIAETRAAQSKFEQVATFYYGDEAQAADATITAVKGVGNVPAYRGTAYIVCTDDDVTDLQGAVPQYEFVVRECGTTTQTGGGGGGGTWFAYSAANGAGAGDSRAIQQSVGGDDWLTLPVSNHFQRIENPHGVATASRVVILGGNSPSVAYYTTDNGASFTEGGAVGDISGGGYRLRYIGGRLFVPRGSYGWAYSDDEGDSFTGNSGYVMGFVGHPGGLIAAGLGGPLSRSLDNGNTWGSGASFYSYMTAGDSDGSRIVAGSGNLFYTDDVGLTIHSVTKPAGNAVEIISVGGGVWVAFAQGEPSGKNIWRSTDNGQTFAALDIVCSFPTSMTPVASQYGGRIVCATSGGKILASTDGGATWIERPWLWTDEGFYYTGMRPEIILPPAGTAIAPSGIELPDAPGWYFEPQGAGFNGGSAVSIEGCDLTLDEIVAAECAQRDVTDIDVSELTDEVIGFRVSSETSPQTNIQSLQSGFMFDGSEYDGVLHFPKRGGATSFALTVDDLAARDGDPIEWERAQEAELLRKVTVGYIDPATTYTTTTQDWERRTGTIQALGEGTMELPVVQDKDWAKQAAEKSLKVGWAETDTCRFSLTRAHSHLVPAQVGTLTDADGVTHRIRITRIEDDGGVRLVEAKRERSNTYNSNAQGTSAPNPGFPGTNLRGPTDAVVMNMPVLRDEDDKPGIYWAARGLLSGWQGAVLQVQRGSDWVTLGQVDAPATMGELLADLPAHAGDVDETNTLTVKMSDDLASVTFHELLSEKNALAIVNADGTVEVVQVQTWTETAPGEWQGTTLIRGRLDTQRSAHAAGSRVVVLDGSVRFAHLQGADLGKTLTFRAVSMGTNPDAAPTFTVTLATMESQREWQPYNIEAYVDGTCQTVVSFIGRHRLGTDAVPVASEWFTGWRVDFSLPGQGTKSRMTQEQSFTYTRAMQTEDWGKVNCGGYTVNVVAVNEYTGADGAGGGGLPDGTGTPNTGNPLTDPDHSATWQEQGTPPDGYVGEPYYLNGDGRDYFVWKGSDGPSHTYGGFTTNITAANDSTADGTGLNGLRVRGIPLTAHTANAAAKYATNLANEQPHEGRVTDSITYAAKPAYSLPNWMARGDNYGVGLVDTTPPWTTMRVWGNGGFLESRAEFTSGLVRAEFTVAGLTDTMRTLLGVVAADPATPDDPGGNQAGGWEWSVPANGTYAVEVDGGTGAIVVRDMAGAPLATHTLALPSGKVYRFRFGGQQSGVTIKANFGNEAWVGAPSAGYGGLPNMATVAPVQWEGIGSTYRLATGGLYGPITNARGNGLLLGSFGKSSGQHRVRFFDATRTDKQRVGLCLTGQTGQLGTTGTSIGYRNSNTVERFHKLQWTWGGGGSATLPAGFDTPESGLIHSRPTDVVFAYDASAATIQVWIAEQNQYNVMKPLRYWTTITGVPAGTWWPALYADFMGEASIYHDATDPSGYSDWTTTV